jgi:Flp pilus assembly CpaE family ATPase
VVCDVLDEMRPVRPRVLVVNRYNPNIPGLSIKKLEEVLKTTGFQTIGNDYAAMNATIDHGRPLRAEAPKSRVLADIVALAQVLFPEIQRPTNGTVGGPFLSTLSRCLGLGKTTH